MSLSRPVPALLLSLSLLASLGCQHPKAEGRPAGLAEAPAPSSSTEGCRAPDEPGCNPCCEQQPDGTCSIRSWSAAGIPPEEASKIEPWYSQVSSAAVCPADCRACARCKERDEKELDQLGTRPECDCSQPPGPDPCFTPQSCGCYCSRLEQLSRACPELVPQKDSSGRD